MGRAEFQYDEGGTTSYYVILAFYALVLFPATYFFFPTDKQVDTSTDERLCHCNGCEEKRKKKLSSQPWKRTKKVLTIVVLLTAWIILAVLVQKVATIENTHEEYDPYSILELDQGAPTSEVKKAYRELSKKFHPDRGGDPVAFDRIAKAYQALTDEEARENWEKYGNPDGPTATKFGIALPQWLVSKEYGYWVLGLYCIAIIVFLPSVVGYWWYNSIKYNADKVLLDTTQLFGYFIRKTPRMEKTRAIMVLGGSFEFNKDYNKEIILRQADDQELPRLMRHLTQLAENKKEPPLSLPYSLKARILLHAFLSRLPLDSEALSFDQKYIVTRVHRLIEEMIMVSQQITYYTPTKIPIDTIDNLLKLFPMFVQAQWTKNSSLLQLPHMNEYNIGYLRRQKVLNCADLAKLDNDKRRQVLNSLSDAQYRDVLVVLSSMPRLSIETNFEVPGEDDSHEVTAGCFVTLKVKLTRHSLLDPVAAGEEALRLESREQEGERNEEDEEEEERNKPEGEAPPTPAETQKKRKVWEKPQQKKKGGNKKKGGQAQKKKGAATSANASTASPSTDNGGEKKKEEEGGAVEDVEREDDERSAADDSADDSRDSGDEGGASSHSAEESDDDGWVSDHKKPLLEAQSVETHTVHAPFYPADKYEWWWLTLTSADKKAPRMLIAPVVSCRTLVDTQTVTLRFSAPSHKGTHVLNLAVHSDAYMDCDYALDIKLDVKEAKEIVVPKYEDTEDEDEEAVVSSDEYTEESDED